MPNSRKRRHQKDRSPRRSGHPAISSRDRSRAIAEFPLLQATDAAEARGDAEAALELIGQDLARRAEANFWRPERVRRLLRLVAFGSTLPRWATSRWILAQAAQHLDPRTRTRFLKAMEIAIETRGGPGTLRGQDDLDARSRIMDHDWVFRQVWLYELGAAGHFVDRVASPDLLAGADHLHEWMRTPMGAFRLVDETPRSVDLLDLATGARVTALNLGTAALLEAGECAIGRLVPIADGFMFESAPLYVPDRVAHRVARAPADWVAAVAAGCREREEGARALSTMVLEFGMLTDVPLALQLDTLIEVAGHLGEPLTAGMTAEELVSAEAAFVRAALDDRLPASAWDPRDWPVVAALLLDPAVFVELASGLTPDDRPRLLRLADNLAGPAGSLCHELALDLDSAA